MSFDGFLKFLERNLYALIMLFIVFIFLASLLFYRLNFSGGLSDSRAVWGQFGDFLGGTLNPIMGFVTVVILISTLKLQRKELFEARDSIRRNNDLVKAQLEIVENQAREATFFKLLEDFERDVNVAKAKKTDGALGVFLACYEVKDISRDSEKVKEAAEIFLKLSEGLTIGVFRYVVIEKFATLVSFAGKLKDNEMHMKLLQTAAGLGLASSIVHHARVIDEGVYAVFKKHPRVLRGLGPTWAFDDEVAKDFFSLDTYNGYLARKGETLAGLDSLVKKFYSDKDA